MPRHALVTGANRGIGLEFVRQLLVRGEHVVATCRNPGAATALNTLAGEYPGRLHVLPLDVADEKSRARLLRELPLVLGEDSRLDLLLNNAGVLHSGERAGQVEAAMLEDSLHTNAIGPFLLAQALTPWLRVAAAGGAGLDAGRQASQSEHRLTGQADVPALRGAVVANLSSIMGSIGNSNEFRSPSYCASKAAQNMLSVQLAHALAPQGIVVLALHPGWVQTEMGGASATVSVRESVRALLQVIDGATPVQSGSFVDWRGDCLPW